MSCSAGSATRVPGIPSSLTETSVPRETNSASASHGLRLAAMNKLFSILFILLMGAHLIRPLGVPGLRKRGDFWKIALVGFVFFGLTILIRPD